MRYWKHSKLIIVVALVAVIVGGLFLAQIVRPARAQGQRAFHLQANAGSATTTPPQVIIMFGTGSFNINGGLNSGEGIFQLFDSSSPTPKTILASGTWTATSLVSYNEVGTWGELASGTAVISIKLILSNGGTEQATLTVVCNIAPAGLFNHQPDGTVSPEGIAIVIGGITLTPVNGLTILDTLGN